MARKLRILVVRDSQADLTAVRRTLQDAEFDPDIAVVHSLAEMERALQQEGWDLVLVDHRVPGSIAPGALDRLEKNGLDIPVVILADPIRNRASAELARGGTADYVLKTDIDRLALIADRALREAAARVYRVELEETVRRTQAQLAKAKRLGLAGAIAGRIAHDFNNLFVPLIGYLTMARKGLPPNAEAQGQLAMVDRTAREMARINQHLLSLSRPSEFLASPTNLNDIVTETSILLRDRLPDGIRVRCHLAANLFPIRAVPEQLLRVLQNTCWNAVEAMGRDGCLTIRTRNAYVDGTEAEHPRLAPGVYARLDVSDTGPGIAQDLHEKIFEPFFTTKHPSEKHSAGLGLSIVQHIVDEHRAHLSLESEPGSGTTFTFYFPRLATSAATLPVAEGSIAG
ncbi:MAG: hypothetical protein JXR37_02725 [Kiritimatiellae bacterium]|nr:hypothetical protein [Kiritimatiellia bacterium]